VGRKILVAGILGLSAFIAYGVYDLWGGRLLLSYPDEASGIIGIAEGLVAKYRAGTLSDAELKEQSADLRRRFNVLAQHCDESDRRRPSHDKLKRLVEQLEAAALQPEMKEMVRARMNTAEHEARGLKDLVGTDQDKPQ
jgi:hypothetical protein